MSGGLVISRWKYYIMEEPPEMIEFLTNLMDYLDHPKRIEEHLIAVRAEMDPPLPAESVGQSDCDFMLFILIERYYNSFELFPVYHFEDTSLLRRYRNLGAAEKWELRLLFMRQIRVISRLTSQRLQWRRSKRISKLEFRIRQRKREAREYALAQMTHRGTLRSHLLSPDQKYQRDLFRVGKLVKPDFFLIIAGLSMLLAMSSIVMALRHNYYWVAPVDEEHSVFQALDKNEVILEFTDYKATWLPPGFELTSEFVQIDVTTRIYRSGESYISINITPSERIIKVDTENAAVERIKMQGIQADLVEKDDQIILIWVYENSNASIRMETNISRQDAIQVATFMKEVGLK